MDRKNAVIEIKMEKEKVMAEEVGAAEAAVAQTAHFCGVCEAASKRQEQLQLPLSRLLRYI
jgi:hypothetical protein